MNKEFIFNMFNNYITKESTEISDLSNIASIVYHEVGNLNWLGFYIFNKNKKTLELGPFQGRSAIATITIDTGVCGFTVRENKTVVINDVCSFPGHIACDIRSKSEIVVPIYNHDGSMWGILDVDSPNLNNFNDEHVELFENICKFITEKVLVK
ncbi:MAG: GAF domain-containing protein [Mycoplasmatales bacterium]